MRFWCMFFFSLSREIPGNFSRWLFCCKLQEKGRQVLAWLFLYTWEEKDREVYHDLFVVAREENPRFFKINNYQYLNDEKIIIPNIAVVIVENMLLPLT